MALDGSLDEIERRLLLEVARDPRADAPRAVYADWLGERGEPRGELIALQLRRDRHATPSARELALLAQHGARWLGGLASAVAAHDPEQLARRFDRGFLARPLVVGTLREAGAPALPLSPGDRARLARLSPRSYRIEDDGPPVVGALYRVLPGRRVELDVPGERVALKATTAKIVWHARAELEALLRHEARLLGDCAGRRHVQQLVGLARGSGRLVLVSRWIEGIGLSELRRAGALDVAQAAALARQCFAGLATLHGGLARRYGHPAAWAPHSMTSHLRLSVEGELIVLDTSSAEGVRRRVEQAAHGEFMAVSKVYLDELSPEQARGQPLTSASDIFCASVALCSLALGERFFSGDSDFARLQAILDFSGDDPRLARLGPLGAILRRGLALAPETRPSAAELEAACAPLVPADAQARLAALVARQQAQR